MSAALTTLGSKLSQRFGMGDSGDVISILKATCFKGPANDAQIAALMIVADQYGLNPFTKEIFAFPDKNNGIVPVVGLDGWARIINSHPQFDGMDFNDDGESIECVIYRKDRAHPIKAREYMAECKRGTQPWQSHPRRMLRHKALIQCARLAFGYVGIYDQDEAERILDINGKPGKQNPADLAQQVQATKPAASAELISRVGAEADRGYDAFSAAWKGLTKAERESFTPEQIESFKERTDKVIEASDE